jgi:sortase A
VRVATKVAHARGRLHTGAAVVLLVVGILLLAEVAVTLVWQEPFTAISARGEQEELSLRLREAESALLAAPTGFLAAGGTDRGAVLARRYRRQVRPGAPLGRIQIPKLGASFVFVETVTRAALRKGPGHYPRTALPGERGTVGLAAHRTTYLAPFRHIDQLQRGDEVVVAMPYGRFRYSVEGAIVVSPTNTASLRRVRDRRLALTTCTPPFSAAKRLIVTARLRSSRLRYRS